MGGQNGAVVEAPSRIESEDQDVTKKKGPEKAPDEKAPETKDETGLFDEADEKDEKALKWRFLAKGPTLDAILSVFGAAPVDGDKQVAFKVKAAGDRELGDVFRAFIQKAHANGVTLADLIKLVNSKAPKK